MAWQTVNPQLPESVKALADSVAGALNSGMAEIDNSLARLQALSVDYTKNPAAGQATGAAAAWMTLIDSFAHAGLLLVVHPYIYGLGEQYDSGDRLAAPNAIKAIADKLTDTWDTNKPSDTIDVLVILAAGKTVDDFLQALSAINKLIPVPALQMAERRARQFQQLENERYFLPGNRLPGEFVPYQINQGAPLQAINQRAGDIVAMAEGYNAENTTPLALLEALAEKKKTRLAQVQTALNEFVSQLGEGGNVRVQFQRGRAAEIAGSLDSPLGFEYGYSAALLITGPAGSLDVARELIGV